MSDLELLLWSIAGLILIYAALRLRTAYKRSAAPGTQAKSKPKRRQGKNILVDGSNVAHWGGAPSAKVLKRVLRQLEAEGWRPYVCFDANIGYKLWDSYANDHKLADELALNSSQIYVVPKGRVADEYLLDVATDRNLMIVTNDRFRDWSVQYPWVKDYRRFKRGRWQDGSVVWGR